MASVAVGQAHLHQGDAEAEAAQAIDSKIIEDEVSIRASLVVQEANRRGEGSSHRPSHRVAMFIYQGNVGPELADVFIGAVFSSIEFQLEDDRRLQPLGQARQGRRLDGNFQRDIKHLERPERLRERDRPALTS